MEALLSDSSRLSWREDKGGKDSRATSFIAGTRGMWSCWQWQTAWPHFFARSRAAADRRIQRGGDGPDCIAGWPCGARALTKLVVSGSTPGASKTLLPRGGKYVTYLPRPQFTIKKPGLHPDQIRAMPGKLYYLNNFIRKNPLNPCHLCAVISTISKILSHQSF